MERGLVKVKGRGEEWGVGSGEWRVESGEWRVEGGEAGILDRINRIGQD